MNNTEILTLLNEGKYDLLKSRIIEEIGREQNKSMPTYRAIQALAKSAERNQRNGKNLDGTYRYVRPAIAGAYYRDGRTYITDGIWGVILNDTVTGLSMAQVEDSTLALENCFPETSDYTLYEDLDFNAMKNFIKLAKADKKEVAESKIFNTLFDAYLFVPVYEALEDCKVYFPQSAYEPIYFEGKNGKALLCPRRPR